MKKILIIQLMIAAIISSSNSLAADIPSVDKVLIGLVDQYIANYNYIVGYFKNTIAFYSSSPALQGIYSTAL